MFFKRNNTSVNSKWWLNKVENKTKLSKKGKTIKKTDMIITIMLKPRKKKRKKDLGKETKRYAKRHLDFFRVFKNIKRLIKP